MLTSDGRILQVDMLYLSRRRIHRRRSGVSPPASDETTGIKTGHATALTAKYVGMPFSPL